MEPNPWTNPYVSDDELVLESATEVGKPVLFGIGIIILVFLPLMTMRK